MTRRAEIHFQRNEFEECEIECEEILAIRDCPEIQALKQHATDKISGKKHWYDVLGVAKDSSKKLVKDAFKELARFFHPNSAKNSKLPKADKKKRNMKMAKINQAKVESGAF